MKEGAGVEGREEGVYGRDSRDGDAGKTQPAIPMTEMSILVACS
jgi:hypothetical protein